MKKYLVLSLLLHLLIFLTVSIKESEQEKSKKPEANKTGSQGQTVDIIENTPGKGPKPKDDRRFYWGIGINVEFLSFQNLYTPVPATKVTHVVPGYCAESSGILENDIIYLVNGSPMSMDNSIEGDGPRKMVLTIFRNGVTVTLQVNRCKVYY